MAVSPDGKTMYLPSLENKFWNVVDCAIGAIIKRSTFIKGRATLFTGLRVIVFTRRHCIAVVVYFDTKQIRLLIKVGPFTNFVRPFTINGKETLAYVTVDSLLGFEVETLQQERNWHISKWRDGNRPVRRHGTKSWYWSYAR